MISTRAFGLETGSEPDVFSSLREIRQDAGRVLALANGSQTNNLLLAETRIAKQLGIFGSPMFSGGPR